MGYHRSSGEWADVEEIVLLGAGTRTATENGAANDVGSRGILRGALVITAASGTTPTLDVAIQTRHDANDSWRTVGSFAQATAAGSERKCFAGLDREIRAVATLGGTTPSFDLTVSGELV
jgi:hypothetical protein